MDRKSQFEVIIDILVIYQCRKVHKISKFMIFLRLPLSTTVNPYLQLCHYYLEITISPLILLWYAYLQICPYLGPELFSILVYPYNLGFYRRYRTTFPLPLSLPNQIHASVIITIHMHKFEIRLGISYLSCFKLRNMQSCCAQE